ncbi:LysR family transcriptional regulator [Providencia sp. PROV255]|uniref:LysR family transcriptional regulator n=1 Tax=Providencia sp. PROV255 TaxID=2949943 RepID=UPI00234976EA|nr:LysR family transcriptional regulator [Providencia sp. PROV255]
MMKGKMNDLHAFLIVAQEQSFTKAAARLGVTPSALSHTIRLLEERLGIRLLARTTRNVSVTEAGAQLMNAIRPLFEQIDIELNALSELRDSPRGTIRLSCTDDQIEIYIRPILNNLVVLGYLSSPNLNGSSALYQLSIKDRLGGLFYS